MSSWNPWPGGASGSGGYGEPASYSLDTRTTSTIDEYMRQGVRDPNVMMLYVPNANPGQVQLYMAQQREADEAAARDQDRGGRPSDSTGQSYTSNELRDRIQTGIYPQALDSGYEHHDDRGPRRQRITRRKTEQDLRSRCQHT
jgi:hypothetical protein